MVPSSYLRLSRTRPRHASSRSPSWTCLRGRGWDARLASWPRSSCLFSFWAQGEPTRGPELSDVLRTADGATMPRLLTALCLSESVLEHLKVSNLRIKGRLDVQASFNNWKPKTLARFPDLHLGNLLSLSEYLDGNFRNPKPENDRTLGEPTEPSHWAVTFVPMPVPKTVSRTIRMANGYNTMFVELLWAGVWVWLTRLSRALAGWVPVSASRMVSTFDAKPPAGRRISDFFFFMGFLLSLSVVSF